MTSTRLVSLLAFTSGCLIGTRGDFAKDVSAAREYAKEEYVSSGWCTKHRVQRCGPTSDATSLVSSNGFVWSDTVHDRWGRRVYQNAGGCLGSGPAKGVRPACPSDDSLVLRDLCAEVLDELHVRGGSVMLACEGHRVETWPFSGSTSLSMHDFSLRLALPRRASDGVTMSLERTTNGVTLFGCESFDGPCDQRLLEGESMWTHFEVERMSARTRCHLELSFTFARGPCDSCAPAPLSPQSPRDG